MSSEQSQLIQAILLGRLTGEKLYKALKKGNNKGIGSSFLKKKHALHALQYQALGLSRGNEQQLNFDNFKGLVLAQQGDIYQSQKLQEEKVLDNTNVVKAAIWYALAAKSPDLTEAEKNDCYKRLTALLLSQDRNLEVYQEILACLLAAYATDSRNDELLRIIDRVLMQARTELQPGDQKQLVTHFLAKQTEYEIPAQSAWAYLTFYLDVSAFEPIHATTVEAGNCNYEPFGALGNDARTKRALAYRVNERLAEIVNTEEAFILEEVLGLPAVRGTLPALFYAKAIEYVEFEEAIEPAEKIALLEKFFTQYAACASGALAERLNHRKFDFDAALAQCREIINVFKRLSSKHAFGEAPSDQRRRSDVYVNTQEVLRTCISVLVTCYQSLSGRARTAAFTSLRRAFSDSEFMDKTVRAGIAPLFFVLFEERSKYESRAPIPELAFNFLVTCEGNIQPPYDKDDLQRILKFTQAGWVKLAEYHRGGLYGFPQCDALAELYEALADDQANPQCYIALAQYYIEHKDDSGFADHAYSNAMRFLQWVAGEARLIGDDQAYLQASALYAHILIDRGHGLSPNPSGVDLHKRYMKAIALTTELMRHDEFRDQGFRLATAAWQKRAESVPDDAVVAAAFENGEHEQIPALYTERSLHAPILPSEEEDTSELTETSGSSGGDHESDWEIVAEPEDAGLHALVEKLKGMIAALVERETQLSDILETVSSGYEDAAKRNQELEDENAGFQVQLQKMERQLALVQKASKVMTQQKIVLGQENYALREAVGKFEETHRQYTVHVAAFQKKINTLNTERRAHKKLLRDQRLTIKRSAHENKEILRREKNVQQTLKTQQEEFGRLRGTINTTAHENGLLKERVETLTQAQQDLTAAHETERDALLEKVRQLQVNAQLFNENTTEQLKGVIVEQEGALEQKDQKINALEERVSELQLQLSEHALLQQASANGVGGSHVDQSGAPHIQTFQIPQQVVGSSSMPSALEAQLKNAMPTSKPFYKRGSFWSVILGLLIAGAGAALTATGIGASIGVPLMAAGGVIAVGSGGKGAKDVYDERKAEGRIEAIKQTWNSQFSRLGVGGTDAAGAVSADDLIGSFESPVHRRKSVADNKPPMDTASPRPYQSIY